MSSTYSTNLALELIGTGDQAGTWGNTTNTNLGTLIEQAISGYVTQAVSTGTDTTITIPNGATGVARNMYIELTGTGGASTNLIVPANKKLYFIYNNTSSGQVTVKVSGQTGVSVPNKAKMILVSDGTDIVDATNYVGNISAASANITVLTSASATITNLIATSASITTLTNNPTFSGGTANGVLYLNASKVATSGSALTFDGTSVTFGSTAQRIIADMSNATVSNRFAFQTSTTNGNTQVNAIPNGTSTSSQFIAYNSSDPNNASSIQLAALSTSTRLLAGQTGTGSYLPITFFTNGTEQARIDTSGNVGIGTSSPAYKLDVRGSTDTSYFNVTSTADANATTIRIGTDATAAFINATGSSSGTLQLRTYGTTRATLDTSGNFGIGTGSNALTNVLTLYATGSTARYMAAGNSNTGLNGTLFGVDGTGNAVINNTQNFAMLFSTNSTERARIDSSGNLGIGTSSPAYKLDVVGPVQTSAGYYINGNASGGYVWVRDNTALRFGTNDAERMRISATGDVGIGTSSPGAKLDVRGNATFTGNATARQTADFTNTGGQIYVGVESSAGGAVFTGSSAYAGILGTNNTTALQLATNGAVRATLDSSGNLGIGTSSPGQKLEVAGNILINTSGNPTMTVKTSGAGNNPGYLLTADTNTWGMYGIFSDANDTLQWQYNGTTRLTLTNDGNLGLGVTPSAYGTRGFDIAGFVGLSQNSAGAAVLAFNNFQNGAGNYIYKTTNPAARYDCGLAGTAAHAWYIAASGTAGNTISFTQAMTLDASGNLGVGATSPSVSGIDIVKSGGTSTYVRTSDGTYSMLSGVAPALGGGLVGTTTNHPVLFYANNNERARITSGGEFLVNTANAAGTSGVGVALNPSDQGVRLVSASTTNSTETLSVYSTGATAYRFYVGWGGTVYATNTTISAISDQRFKENISDLDVGLDAVLALKPRKFDWKEGKGKDIKGDRGFIAQEFEQVFPDLVDEWRDPAPEGEEPYKSVRQDLIPVLVKAIQEQQAMIKSLEAKVAALESK
jgi:hypothetical protein